MQSIPPHLPRGVEKGPICIIKSPKPKYIFFPPENAPGRAQKRETVSGHLGNAVSHVVDTCLQLPSIPPNTQRTLLPILVGPAPWQEPFFIIIAGGLSKIR